VFDNDIMVAGADPGFGAIKLSTGDEKILFPALICNGSERIFSLLGNSEKESGSDLERQIASLDVIVKNNSSGVERHYFMGSLAEQLNPKEVHYCWDEDKSDDEEAMALLIVSIALAQPYPKTNVYLGTGVPVKYFATLRDKYQNELKGSFSVTFLSGPRKGQTRSMNILRSRVLPQSYGVFIKETLTENGGARNDKYQHGYVLVIDPGFRTTDVAMFYDHTMLDSPNSFSLEKGLQWAYGGIAAKLRDMTQSNANPIETEDQELDKIFRAEGGFYPWNNGAIDLNPIMRSQLSQLARDIVREIMRAQTAVAGRIHTILVSGKVGEMIYDYMNLENKILIDDPQFGNADGFRIVAANLLNDLTRRVESGRAD
jgi:plasmid segregation protein ParM